MIRHLKVVSWLHVKVKYHQTFLCINQLAIMLQLHTWLHSYRGNKSLMDALKATKSRKIQSSKVLCYTVASQLTTVVSYLKGGWMITGLAMQLYSYTPKSSHTGLLTTLASQLYKVNNYIYIYIYTHTHILLYCRDSQACNRCMHQPSLSNYSYAVAMYNEAQDIPWPLILP